MQCACAILSYVACSSRQYFSTLSHKRRDFRGKKKLSNINCVFWFYLQLLSETFLILRRTERYMIRNVYWYSSKVPIILVTFNETWVFSTNFLKIFKYHFSWKSLHWEPSSSIRTDRHDEVISCFSRFCERIWKLPSKACLLRCICDFLQFPLDISSFYNKPKVKFIHRTS
jgi:hypothetical protein